MKEQKHYTNEQKYEAIKLSDSIGTLNASKELNISTHTIARWRMNSRRSKIVKLHKEEAITPAIYTSTTAERFSIGTVAAVTGYTEGSISQWLVSNKGTAKNGMTINDVIEYLSTPKVYQKNQVDEESAKRLRIALEVMGKITPELELRG